MKAIYKRLSKRQRRWFIGGTAFFIFMVISATIGAFLPEQEAEVLPVAGTQAESDRLAKVAESDAKQVEEKAPVAALVAEPAGRDEEIRGSIEDIHADRYTGSEIVEIEVNENLGLNDGSYVVLAHFSFTRTNSAEKTLDLISMYSEDLAASLAETTDVSAVSVFFEAPRFVEGKNATKFAYKRSGIAMILDNEFIVPELK